MAELLALEEREWLLDALRELVARCGSKAFMTAPILEPTARDFPYPFEPDVRGVRVLLQRLLTCAGLGSLGVELEAFSQPDEVRELDARGGRKAWGHQSTAAWFAGIRYGRCQFGIARERIREPETLVATLCHEVAHAWRSVQELVVEDRVVEERLTDLTTVYLGFGLLTTNCAHTYRVESELTGGAATGAIAVTSWSHSRAGYLSPEAMSFLLAAQARSRGLGWNARRRLAGKLEANQASSFRRGLRRLLPAEELRRQLGVRSDLALCV
jgi:hypothetical protein